MAQSTKEEKINIKKLYGFECISSKEDFLKKYKIDLEKGLSNEQVENRLSTYGKNEMKQKKQKKWYNYLLDSLLSPFNIILMGITIILIYTDIILTSPPSYANIIVILVLVLASTLLEFFEVYNSNKAAEKLKDLVATTCTVIRNETKIKIPLNEITIGDVILLSAGDIIPADVRVLEAKDLYITQSSLTGESDSVKKSSSTELSSIDEIESITDLDTICFMGTNVTSGSGKAIVIKTGDSTYFGKVANTITSGKPITSFQKGINNLSKLLIRFMLILIPITFLLNNAKHGSLTAFTFSVAIAIGITPLLLPVILSSSLSKGAVKMSKKKTIVKRLDSIQSFGSMNILCTDKTGTLTEDNIVLEKYLDIKGNEDKKILEYVFLNSYFQTGLKGNIDEAVIKRAEKEEINVIASKYKKIDEIPFDFSRRRLSVIVSDGTSKKLITKGAIEEILSVCTTVNYKDTINPITSDIKNNILSISKNLNIQGMRVVGVCQKTDIENISEFSVKDESKMTFLGFIGFLDPPKESAKSAIERLNSYGVRVMVLTGDNEYVTRAICEKVNISTKRILTGNKVDKLSDMALLRLLRSTNVLAKLSPIQKARVVRLLKDAGNIVGYMGDGINDSPSLINSDVGVSVDTAVDIAKESADIILLEKDLHVLLEGVKEGRHTFANLMKYIKLAASFNFGEVMSVIIASIILPFLPETPIQLLVEGLLYDFGQLTLPLDNVDEEYLRKPKKIDIKGLKHFMLFMGPFSSCFDLIVFASLWFFLGIREAAVFQTVWFVYSIVSNLIGMHMIRTAKIPFVQSHAHKMVYFSSILLCIIGIIVPFTFFGRMIGLVAIPLSYLGIIFSVTFLYCVLSLFAKKIYIKKYGEWI